MVVQENIEDQEVTRKAPKYPITLHISEGNKLSRLAQYEKAISCFDAGLKIQPNNIRCLLGKTKCLMKLCKYEEAKQIAEEIIKLEPRCAEAYTLLGNTEFTKGNFEDGYIAFSSGYRKRPYSLDLRLGYQMCKKALNNSHDSDVPIALDHTDVKEVKNILQNKCKRQNSETRRTFNRKRMYNKDMQLIKSLLCDKDFSSITPVCEDLFEYLKDRKEFWRTHDPCLKKTPVTTDHEKIDVQKLLEFLSNKCALAEKCFSEDDNETCKDICHEIIDIMDKSFDYFTIESLKIKADALHFLGLAYMLGNNTSSALKYHKLQLKIAEDCSAADLKKRSFYDIGEDFLRSGNYEQALTSFRQCMEFVEAKHEEAIVLYKIADCELYLENLKNATKNGRNSLSIATSCHDDRLQCDTTMLLAEIALRKKNMKDAKNLYAEALAVAEESKDSRLDRIKDLINMFHEKLDDRSREESILSFANKMEESRSNLRRMIYIGSIKSKEKYNSRHCNKPSHLQAEESTKIKQLDTDSISSESSNQYIDLNTKNVRNNSNTYEGS
ncbi:Tetratricopeptide repeat protein 25 like protein [Argiope bruennichi]|uniref:Outer dynein arm-docking complex subunit 4 n=1 Tax=Argiope bruennichi TaxID=94029 RepID=A0A8T0E0B4_ARGBR|nr:Tetratricopeptide repeat protein 25 like protein [Argiope bruennichi]